MHDSPLRTKKGKLADGLVMTPYGPATVQAAMEMVKEDLEDAKYDGAYGGEETGTGDGD